MATPNKLYPIAKSKRIDPKLADVLTGILGEKACINGSLDTYFRYATKNDSHLVVHVGMDYRAGQLTLEAKFGCAGDRHEFEPTFQKRESGVSFSRLNKVAVTLASGSLKDCVDALKGAEVLLRFSDWLDKKVESTGAKVVPGLIMVLLTNKLTDLKRRAAGATTADEFESAFKAQAPVAYGSSKVADDDEGPDDEGDDSDE